MRILVLAAPFVGMCVWLNTITREQRLRALMDALQTFTSPEDGHRLGVWAASLSPFLVIFCHLHSESLNRGDSQRYYMDLFDNTDRDPILATSVWSRSFVNPVGIAAGFDVRL